MMKKIVYHGPKKIETIEAEVPVPGPGEIVVKNKVALTCGTDVKIYKRGYIWDPPFSFGHEASGVVWAIGEGVEKFSVGDRVFAHNTAPCNTCYFCKEGLHSLCENLTFNMGAFAEFQKIPRAIVEQNTYRLPDTMSHETAALTEPFSCAVYGTDLLPIEMGSKVCVNGCGPLGLMFIKLCTLRGAEVIACDMTEERLEKARKMGAKYLINVSGVEDQVESVRALTPDGRGVDIAIEAVGLPAVWDLSIQMVRKGGFVLCFGGTQKGSTVTLDTTKLHYEQLTVKGIFHTTPRHVMQAFEMLKMGVLQGEDFIDHAYGIEETEEALIEHSKGHVIKNCIRFD